MKLKKGKILIATLLISLCYSFSAFASVDGWISDEKGTWFQYKDGTYPQSAWILKDDKMYYVGSDGYRIENSTICNGKYAFDENGVCTNNIITYGDVYNAESWINDGVGWKYHNEDGTYAVNNKILYKGLCYYIGTDGYMLHDCYTRSGSYCGSDGLSDGKLHNNVQYRQSMSDEALFNVETGQRSSSEEGNVKKELSIRRDLSDAEKQQAWETVKKAAKRKLKYPHTSKFPEWNNEDITYIRDADSNEVMVEGWCEARNGFGIYNEVSITAFLHADSLRLKDDMILLGN